MKKRRWEVWKTFFSDNSLPRICWRVLVWMESQPPLGPGSSVARRTDQEDERGGTWLSKKEKLQRRTPAGRGGRGQMETPLCPWAIHTGRSSRNSSTYLRIPGKNTSWTHANNQLQT